MLKPMAATAKPRTMASGRTDHQLVAAKMRRAQAPKNHARMVAVLKYIPGQSRLLRPVRSKYASTRLRNSLMNRSLPVNLSGGLAATGAAATDGVLGAMADIGL